MTNQRFMENYSSSCGRDSTVSCADHAEVKGGSGRRRLVSFSKLDPNSTSDDFEGNLRYDLFGAKTGNRPYADRDGSGNTTPHSTNYAVCPRELSLRLHEVIQSRLEERVKELEMELQNCQRKLKHMESEHIHPWRELPENKMGTSSSGPDEQQCIDQPVIINLAGEALSAYNEAYES